jgi:hypothetical protein
MVRSQKPLWGNRLDRIPSVSGSCRFTSQEPLGSIAVANPEALQRTDLSRPPSTTATGLGSLCSGCTGSSSEMVGGGVPCVAQSANNILIERFGLTDRYG